MMIEIGLSSGRILSVNTLMLYPALLVEQAVLLRAQSMSKMGTTSTGIGFLGSPGWAITGALVVGALEASINNKNHKEGALLLQDSFNKSEEAKHGGKFVNINRIKNIDRPQPSSWKATYNHEEVVSFAGLKGFEIDEVCEKYGIDRTTVYKSGIFSDPKLLKNEETVRWSEDYIYDGEEFLKCESCGEIVNIKWSDVSTYRIL